MMFKVKMANNKHVEFLFNSFSEAVDTVQYLAFCGVEGAIFNHKGMQLYIGIPVEKVE